MDNLFLNTKFLSLRFPLSAILFYMGKKEYFQKKILQKAFHWAKFKGQNTSDFARYWDEIKQFDFVPMKPVNQKQTGNTLSSSFGKWLYICVRAVKPQLMIETGVSHGYSSWLILNAMAKNGSGHLYSIDLAGKDTNSDYNLPQEKIGQVVSDELKSNWTLLIGDVREKLPELFTRLNSVDIFFHDSDHSYEHMKFEFEMAFKHLQTNGIILSDDIHKNNAFEEFTVKNQLKTCVFTKGGMCFKTD